jgi:hypothetical protein
MQVTEEEIAQELAPRKELEHYEPAFNEKT